MINEFDQKPEPFREPRHVVLTEDFLDLLAGLGIREGTELVRNDDGLYQDPKSKGKGDLVSWEQIASIAQVVQPTRRPRQPRPKWHLYVAGRMQQICKTQDAAKRAARKWSKKGHQSFEIRQGERLVWVGRFTGKMIRWTRIRKRRAKSQE